MIPTWDDVSTVDGEQVRTVGGVRPDDNLLRNRA